MSPVLLTLARYAVARLKEPSTYLGLGTILVAAHIQVPDATLASIVQVLIALAGVAATLLPDPGSK